MQTPARLIRVTTELSEPRNERKNRMSESRCATCGKFVPDHVITCRDCFSSHGGASEAQPLQAVSPSTNCSAEAGAEAHSDSLINSVVPPNEAIRRDTDALLACPFCGDQRAAVEWEPSDPLWQGDTNRNWFVECRYCGAQGPCSNREDHALRNWAQRAGATNAPAPALAVQRERAIRRNAAGER